MRTDETRRNALILATAFAALGTGIAAYWWHSKNGGYSNFQTSESDRLRNRWDQVLVTPAGSNLKLASFLKTPLLINFWATWCPPCVEELPLLDRFFVENQSNGVQILGLAVDKVEAVSTFLRKTPLSFPIAITGATGISLSKSWGNLSSGLPFSILLDANGRIMQRKMGKLNGSDLSTWLTALQSQK